MQEPRRVESTVVPKVFEDLGNGNWYYNYDIKSEEVPVPHIDENDTESTETRYNYIQIKIASKPDYKKCVELIIREYITQSQEFDLINSYNRAVLNLLSEDGAVAVVDKYLEYLYKVTEIKNNIKKDFNITDD